MPAVIAAGAIDELAFGIIAIVILLAVATFIVGPIRSTSQSASSIAVIGGAISWVLWQAANAVQAVIDSSQWMVDQGRAAALDTWNWLHYWTTVYQFGWVLTAATWVQAHSPALQIVLSQWDAVRGQVYGVLPSAVRAVANDVTALHMWIDGSLLPRVVSIGTDLAELHRWIDTYLLRRITGIEAGVRGIESWITQPWGVARDIGNAEARAKAYASALAVPISAAITEIENSPCMRACEPLGELGSLLQGLEGAGILAIMMALVAEVRHDPSQVQNQIRQVVQPIVSDVANSLGVGP